MCHFVCPWNEFIISRKQMGREADSAQLDGPPGKQYYF
jgi:hypothetical protein